MASAPCLANSCAGAHRKKHNRGQTIDVYAARPTSERPPRLALRSPPLESAWGPKCFCSTPPDRARMPSATQPKHYCDCTLRPPRLAENRPETQALMSELQRDSGRCRMGNKLANSRAWRPDGLHAHIRFGPRPHVATCTRCCCELGGLTMLAQAQRSRNTAPGYPPH